METKQRTNKNPPQVQSNQQKSSIPEEIDAIWRDCDSLAAEIGRQWAGSAGAADAIREGRRDL